MAKMELDWRTAGGGRKKVGGQVNNGVESLLSERHDESAEGLANLCPQFSDTIK